MLDFLKQLKPAFYYSGVIFVISLLMFFRIDFYASVAAVSTFLIFAVRDTGRNYINITNQSETVKCAFDVIMDPLLAITCVSSFFYVAIGEMNWFFWLVAFFLGLLLFAADAVALFKEVKKS
jgi:hypothetical protein